MTNSEGESEAEYSEGEHESGGDDTDDEGGPNTAIAAQRAENTPLFMRALHFQAIHTPKFPEYVNMVSGYVANEEFHGGMIFSNREVIVRAVKNYSISRSVDYKVHESELLTFYCKCKHFGSGCHWLIRVSFRKNQDIWEVRKYNGPHTCTSAMLSQDHTKLDSNMIAQYIEPMVRADPSLKVKNVIAKIQNRYGYLTTYPKIWMAKQRAIERVCDNWERFV